MSRLAVGFFGVFFSVPCCDSAGFSHCRVSSIENDSKYKRTWGIGGGDEVGGGSGGKIVSRQPSAVRNGQAARAEAPPPSGPYIKRWAGPGFFSGFAIKNLLFK